MILENVRKELESHKRQLEFLNPRMDTLRQFSEGYLDNRRRFFDIYRRDIKHPKEQSEMAMQPPMMVMQWLMRFCLSATREQIEQLSESYMA